MVAVIVKINKKADEDELPLQLDNMEMYVRAYLAPSGAMPTAGWPLIDTPISFS